MTSGAEPPVAGAVQGPLAKYRSDWIARPGMENFTPGSAAVGGVLIGCATLLLWILNGRVAGISGILGGLAQAPSDDRWWRVAFIGGLIVAPLVFSASSVHGV